MRQCLHGLSFGSGQRAGALTALAPAEAGANPAREEVLPLAPRQQQRRAHKPHPGARNRHPAASWSAAGAHRASSRRRSTTGSCRCQRAAFASRAISRRCRASCAAACCAHHAGQQRAAAAAEPGAGRAACPGAHGAEQPGSACGQHGPGWRLGAAPQPGPEPASARSRRANALQRARSAAQDSGHRRRRKRTYSAAQPIRLGSPHKAACHKLAAACDPHPK